jgi:hypothetical protein
MLMPICLFDLCLYAYACKYVYYCIYFAIILAWYLLLMLSLMLQLLDVCLLLHLFCNYSGMIVDVDTNVATSYCYGKIS